MGNSLFKSLVDSIFCHVTPFWPIELPEPILSHSNCGQIHLAFVIQVPEIVIFLSVCLVPERMLRFLFIIVIAFLNNRISVIHFFRPVSPQTFLGLNQAFGTKARLSPSKPPLEVIPPLIVRWQLRLMACIA